MDKSLFDSHGIHCVVDGQFGSTGKGVLAAWLAKMAVSKDIEFRGTFSNAGPNSGHTFYHNGEKHVLKQLPTFAVATHLLTGEQPFVHPVILTAGAIIDPQILAVEATKYPDLDIYVNPNAAVIRQEDKEAEHSGSVAAVAGTRSGTGVALARKVLREPDAVFSHFYHHNVGYFPRNVVCGEPIRFSPFEKRYFMEVSQGFSLGIHESRFYPKTTSRECTVMQGIADARMPPRSVTRTYLSMRTFPIRVGNHEGFSSGDCYPDQQETSWEAIGQMPELTTVTQRIRRVFTWSDLQACEAVVANDPDFVFINFLNYLTEEGQRGILERLDDIRDDTDHWFGIIGGWGATSDDVGFV